jgi:hypothetical protein
MKRIIIIKTNKPKTIKLQKKDRQRDYKITMAFYAITWMVK